MRINILFGSIGLICILVLYFTVPVAVLTGNDLTVEDVRAGLSVNLGWRCLGSPAPLFKIHWKQYKAGAFAALREKMQVRCFLNKDDDFLKTLTGDDYREQVAKAYREGLNKSLEPAIFDHNLKALSLAIHFKNKTVCYFPGVGQWTQCDGLRSCLRGACKNQEWLSLPAGDLPGVESPAESK
jgi:hypothetical protein